MKDKLWFKILINFCFFILMFFAFLGLDFILMEDLHKINLNKSIFKALLISAGITLIGLLYSSKKKQ